MIEQNARPKLSVIGTGYLGATHAVCMVELGFEVIGLDVDPAKIGLLRAGEVPFFEPGPARAAGEAHRQRPAAVHHLVRGGRRVRRRPLRLRRHPAAKGELRGRPDATSRPRSASLAEHLDRKALVVGKSTVPGGHRGADRARCSGRSPPCPDVELAWNPEFLREGFAVEDTLQPRPPGLRRPVRAGPSSSCAPRSRR